MAIKFIDDRAKRQLNDLLIGGLAQEFSNRPEVQAKSIQDEFRDNVRQQFGLPTSDTPDVPTLF